VQKQRSKEDNDIRDTVVETLCLTYGALCARSANDLKLRKEEEMAKMAKENLSLAPFKTAARLRKETCSGLLFWLFWRT
jgi:hypothetical protein